MSKDLVLYHVYGRLENETLQRENISRDEIPDIIRAYIAEEGVTYHMILGINGDGVICSPIKDWTPEHPDAFSSLEVVPWVSIQKIRNKLRG